MPVWNVYGMRTRERERFREKWIEHGITAKWIASLYMRILLYYVYEIQDFIVPSSSSSSSSPISFNRCLSLEWLGKMLYVWTLASTSFWGREWSGTTDRNDDEKKSQNNKSINTNNDIHIEERKCGNNVTVEGPTNHECLLYSTIPISKAAYFQLPNRFAHLIESHSKCSFFSSFASKNLETFFFGKLRKPVLVQCTMYNIIHYLGLILSLE